MSATAEAQLLSVTSRCRQLQDVRPRNVGFGWVLGLASQGVGFQSEVSARHKAFRSSVGKGFEDHVSSGIV